MGGRFRKLYPIVVTGRLLSVGQFSTGQGKEHLIAGFYFA